MSYACEVRGFRDWLPNSYRFETQDEAESFVQKIKAEWIPSSFVSQTRTQESSDPVNARWDPKKKDAVKSPVTEIAAAPKKETAASSYQPPPMPPPPCLEALVASYGMWPNVPEHAWRRYNEEMEAWKTSIRHGDRWEAARLTTGELQWRRDERAEMEELLDQRRALPRTDTDTLLPTVHRRVAKPSPVSPGDRVAPICDDCVDPSQPPTGPQHYGPCSVCGVRRACFGDPIEQPSMMALRRELAIHGTEPTNWQEYEDKIIQSPALRHDLRCLLSHGNCRFDISRRIFDAFKDACGRAPNNVRELCQWLETPLGQVHFREEDLPTLRTLKIIDGRKRRELAKRRREAAKKAAGLRQQCERLADVARPRRPHHYSAETLQRFLDRPSPEEREKNAENPR